MPDLDPARFERLFFELFEGLPRQGPGTLATARRSLAACVDLPEEPRILDLGCGAGGQTLHLARLTRGSVLAVDAHAPLVARLRESVREHGLDHRIEARGADMTQLDVEPHSFDLVWSEGALYNLGLERALPLCASLLRSGGHLVFTDAVWRSADPPPAVRALFADYPTMGTTGDVLEQLGRSPWQVLDHFDLPDEAWWTDFYGPMEARIAELRLRYAGDSGAQAALDELATEPQLHRDHAATYAYGCFIARRL